MATRLTPDRADIQGLMFSFAWFFEPCHILAKEFKEVGKFLVK